MTKTKIVRCAAPGCRILTAGGVCDQHRDPAATAPSGNAVTPDRLAQLQAALAAAIEWERHADANDAQRAVLADLRRGAEAADRRTQRPIFAEDRA